MHECPWCGCACDCDGEDTWLDAPEEKEARKAWIEAIVKDVFGDENHSLTCNQSAQALRRWVQAANMELDAYRQWREESKW